jgi:hypothetical protein
MDDLTPETLMKCDTCGGGGAVPVGEHFVTHDMASDAGDPAMEGASLGIEWGPCPDCAERHAYAEAWKSQVASLTARLEDWERAAKVVMDEDCAPDEKHCTCVPFLRRQIASLTSRFDEAERQLEIYKTYISPIDGMIAEARIAAEERKTRTLPLQEGELTAEDWRMIEEGDT